MQSELLANELLKYYESDIHVTVFQMIIKCNVLTLKQTKSNKCLYVVFLGPGNQRNTAPPPGYDNLAFAEGGQIV